MKAKSLQVAEKARNYEGMNEAVAHFVTARQRARCESAWRDLIPDASQSRDSMFRDKGCCVQ